MKKYSIIIMFIMFLLAFILIGCSNTVKVDESIIGDENTIDVQESMNEASSIMLEKESGIAVSEKEDFANSSNIESNNIASSLEKEADDTVIAVEPTGNPTANQFLDMNSAADIFVYEQVVYVQAKQFEIEWVESLQIEIGNAVGEIKRTNLNQIDEWQNFDATILPMGTTLYETTHHDIYVAKTGNDYIRYFGMREG